MKKIVVLFVIFLVVFAVAGCVFLAPTAPMDVIMPELRGQVYNEVINGEYKEFKFVFDQDNPDDLMFSDEYPEGTICYQDCEPGVIVKSTAKIKIRVSKGKEQIAVPDVYGLPYDEARGVLEAAGFKVSKIDKNTDDGAAAGSVLYTNPPKGAIYDKGAWVSVFVSVNSGPAPKPRVFSVLGKSEEDARAALAAAGFRVEIIYKEDSAPKGTVISQSPAAGRVEYDTTVTITVSRGMDSE